MRQISVGLVGYGLAGSVFHAPLLSASKMWLAAVVTSRVEQLKADLPEVEAVPSLDRLLADSDIELVVVASPTATHFEIARAALEHGKNVVVDKPFTVTVREADTLIELAARRNLLLSVFQNRRWDNDFLTVKSCIEQGELGAIYHFESHFDRFRPRIRPGWREEPGRGSGILYDLGAHLIDQALLLFGMPSAVTADVLVQRSDARATDYFHLILDYGRMRAILHGSALVCGPGPHFLVHGDGGSFVKYGMDSQEEALKAGKRPGDPEWGLDKPEQYGELTLADGTRRRVETIRGGYEHFYEGIAASLLHGAPPPINPVDSRNGLVVIEAALRSAAERRTVAII